MDQLVAHSSPCAHDFNGNSTACLVEGIVPTSGCAAHVRKQFFI